jgi:hypothetical protein
MLKSLTPLGNRSLACVLLGLLGFASGCKDDDPCDPGQVERNTQCYPAPSPEAGGSPASAPSGAAGDESSGGAVDGMAGAGAATLDTPFGTACQDKTDSSDCGGQAPICADLSPLGQSVYCTQINCAEGEANASVCPADFTCFAVPGYPSVCIKK